ncbi:MAG: hypothetical protein BJ554DRAFT_6634, partial [Olpidium bornovanus]
MSTEKRVKSFSTNLFAGGAAGCMEALVCHPPHAAEVLPDNAPRLSDYARLVLLLTACGILRTGSQIVFRWGGSEDRPGGGAARPLQGPGCCRVWNYPEDGNSILQLWDLQVLGHRQRRKSIHDGYFLGYVLYIKGSGENLEPVWNCDGSELSLRGAFPHVGRRRVLEISSSRRRLRLSAGLAAGTTEAVMVVTPMDVIKIRLQAQRHSMADPLDIPKYRNAGH